ncbi:RES family NAD+ phosphorylase [Bradyrhizobium jicamae]|uniref:RES family NAD+ phosphorylase n=1 Tax=Bradyrhizobium jicamae TaxID=280332 RepID=UPI001BA751C4|nr:RES family NAD+ phosphorylase [Bradyrhizobium jicamae]MBR0751730.1 RES family NAD+ phosphorylase [Bradyrhizobium jicamae]
MLDQLGKAHRADKVLRLASLSDESLEAILLEFGVGIEDLEDVRDAAVRSSVVVNPNDAIRFSFVRERFWPGRFNREGYGVYYAALEGQTCIEEVKNYQNTSMTAQSSAKYYRFISAQFDGMTVDLRGQEGAHPQLTSTDKSGYPFCQSLADVARQTGIDAFYTYSARDAGGTCVPVFQRSALQNPSLGGGVRYYWNGASVSHIEF